MNTKLRKQFENIVEIKGMLLNNDELKWCDESKRYINGRVFQDAETGYINGALFGWIQSANREGYKLVPVDEINIMDMIHGKCPCGSSRSPIISDNEGYNLIHCFACGANKYIHKDY